MDKRRRSGGKRGRKTKCKTLMKRGIAVDTFTDADESIGITIQSFMKIILAAQTNRTNAHQKLTKMDIGRNLHSTVSPRESQNEEDDAIHTKGNKTVNKGLEPIQRNTLQQKNAARTYREGGVTHTRDSNKEPNRVLHSDPCK